MNDREALTEAIELIDVHIVCPHRYGKVAWKKCESCKSDVMDENIDCWCEYFEEKYGNED